MRPSTRLVALVLASACCLAAPYDIVHAQPPVAPQLEIRCFDMVTGFPIDVADIRIDGRSLGSADIVSRSGISAFALSSAFPRVAIGASGYQVLSADLSAIAGASTSIRLLLSPTAPPPEVAAIAPQSGAMVISGFVSDEESGLPLANVIVRTTDGSAIQSLTNSRGFFLLRVPTDPADKRGTTDLVFERSGFVSIVRRHILLVSGDVAIYRINMSPGEGRSLIDEEMLKRQVGSEQDHATDRELKPSASTKSANQSASTITIPTSIRVGSGCNSVGLNCTKVTVLPFSDYLKRVLPHEWSAGWDPDALKAGAVAVRTYSMWFVQNPRGPDFDICDTDSCQVYDPSFTRTSTDSAIDATANIYLIDANGSVPKSEFSAENNDSGCGKGYSGEKDNGGRVLYPCFEDAVCKLAPHNGHGRGMCQNGSQRWAAGTMYGTDGNPTPSGDPPRPWRWIVNHYYSPAGYRIAGDPPSGPPPVIDHVVVNSGTQGIDLQIFGRLFDDVKGWVRRFAATDWIQSCAEVSKSDKLLQLRFNCGQPLESAMGAAFSGDTADKFVIMVQNADGQVSDPTEYVPGSVSTLSAPTRLTFDTSASTISLFWQPPSTGSVTSYVIEAGSSSGATNLANFSTGNTQTSYFASGIGPGEYFVRVRASNGNSLSAPSNEVDIRVGSSCGNAPSAPGSLSYALNGSTLNLTWAASSGAPTSYVVEAGTIPGASNLAVADTGSPALTYSASGLANGTYYIRLKARNACGTSGPSNEIVVSVGNTGTTQGLPAVATGSATDVTLTGATLNGTVNPNGSSTTAYFQWGSSTAYGNTTTSQFGGGTTATSVAIGIGGLAANTIYHYRIVATNSAGTSNGADSTFQTSSSGTTSERPGAFTLFSPTALCNGTSPQIVLSWSASSGATSYDLYRGGVLYSPGIPSSTLSFTNTGSNISLGTTYSYFVRAKNSVGSTDSFSVSATAPTTCSTSTPGVTTTAATSVGTTTATLNGSVNPNGLFTSGYFEYGTTTAYGSTSFSQSGSGTSSLSISAGVSGLVPNTAYHYRLVASNNAGTTNGNDVTFTTSGPTASAPGTTTLSATNVTASGATLSGSVNPNGADTNYFFQYGSSSSYGNQTPSLGIGSGTSALTVSFTLSGLSAGTTYHFRIGATNSRGTLYGGDATFTTTASSTPLSIFSVSPSSITKGYSYTFTLFGSGFQPGFSATLINELGQQFSIGTTSYSSSSTLSATAFIGDGGTATQSIRITNPNGQSGTISFSALCGKFCSGDRVTVSGTGTSGLNLRSCASTSCSVLANLPEGTAMTVFSGPQGADGFVWWAIQGTVGGVLRTGWAADQFLRK